MSPTRKVAWSKSYVSRDTYVACLDCGQEFDYDWQQMQIGRRVAARVSATPAESFAAADRQSPAAQDA